MASQKLSLRGRMESVCAVLVTNAPGVFLGRFSSCLLPLSGHRIVEPVHPETARAGLVSINRDSQSHIEEAGLTIRADESPALGNLDLSWAV